MFKAHPRTFDFKKQFRLQMDNEFDINMHMISKHLLEKELEEMTKEKDENDSGIHENTASKENMATTPLTTIGKNPIKFLINYDREVERVAKHINELFDVYSQFPKCYPKLDEEKEYFKKYLGIVKFEKTLDQDEMEQEFVKYWESRIKVLRKSEIEKQKEDIRQKWENFTPRYDGSLSFTKIFKF